MDEKRELLGLGVRGVRGRDDASAQGVPSREETISRTNLEAAYRLGHSVIDGAASLTMIRPASPVRRRSP